jgi:carboxypeptidase C (cathepsin A)
MNLQGVFLMGQAVNIIEYSQRTENIVSYVVSLPTLAATAWEFGKADAKGRSFEDFMSDAANFSDTEYLAALYQGQAIAEETKVAIAAALEVYTGISADYYTEHNLRISKETFRVELLKADGLVLGRSDARYTAPATPEVPTPDASAVLGEAYAAAFGKYFAATFGTPLPADYQAAATDVGMGDWDWGGNSPFDHFAYGKRLNLAFDANPDFRLMIGNGYHDTMTTVGAARYALLQSDWPKDRVKLSWYQGGHMAYSIDASAAAFGNDIRTWIRGEAAGPD